MTRKKMTNALKLFIVAASAVAACSIWFLSEPFQTTKAQTSERPTAIQTAEPDLREFDDAVQKRFLTMPSFGMARMVTSSVKLEPLESNHVPRFHASDENEAAILNGFKAGGWEVGLYLFGKRTIPKPKQDPANPKKFTIRYRINKAAPVTVGLKDKELPNAKGLMDQVKAAFNKFQTGSPTEELDLRFAKDEWNFVAKPVRAVNESCVSCHGDYVVLQQLEKNRYKFRKRMIGDVNGVVVYAYRRSKP
jgi:hypothetical protein